MSEPSNAPYIWVNPNNNFVHVFVPLVGGREISTDNTCQTGASIDSFQQRIMQTLLNYRNQLTADLRGLSTPEARHPLLHRLSQINAYIRQLFAFHNADGGINQLRSALMQLKYQNSNLYPIELMPEVEGWRHGVNPVFTVPFAFKARLTEAFADGLDPHLLGTLSPREAFKRAVRDRVHMLLTHRSRFSLLQRTVPTLELVQQVLTEKCQEIFPEQQGINFYSAYGAPVTEPLIADTLGCPVSGLDIDDRIDGLLGLCAEGLFSARESHASLFQDMGNITALSDKRERLSILTQFFLAHVNVYAIQKGVVQGRPNFGRIVNRRSALSEGVAEAVVSALQSGAPVEAALIAFMNTHRSYFKLQHELTPEDAAIIEDKFKRTYQMVESSRHMDEFVLLDLEAPTGAFVTHQWNICTDFSELLRGEHLNFYFKLIRDDFRQLTTRDMSDTNDLNTANQNTAIAAEFLAYGDALLQPACPQPTGLESTLWAAASALVVSAAVSTTLVYTASMTWFLALSIALPMGVVLGAAIGLTFFFTERDPGDEPLVPTTPVPV